MDGEGRFSRGRLEAFSDGVIAVIITIMVLDLKAPESDEPAALLKLWPSFLIYLVSFLFVAIYWINHHHLLMAAKRVTARLIWANAVLLFVLSLVPFATAYVGTTRLAPFPTMIYGILQLACALAYSLLVATIWVDRKDDADFLAVYRARRAQDLASLVVYAAGTVVALYSPPVALVFFIAVSLAYLVPGLIADRVRRHGGGEQGVG